MKNRFLQPAIYVAGTIGLLVAIATIKRPTVDDLPGAGTLAIAVLLQLLSLMAAAQQWSTLIGATGRDRESSHRTLYLSQLAKYLPAGGVVQAASQIAGSEGQGATSMSVRAGRYLLGVLQLAASALVVGGLMLFGGGWRAVIGGLALAAGMAFSHPRATQWALKMSARVLRRPGSQAPAPSVLGRAQLWSLLNIALLAMAFAVLDSAVPGPLAGGAFALAWLAGFVVAPIPAGLGVREAVLTVLLAPTAPAAALILTALVLRILGLVAEVLLVVATQSVTFLRRSRK